MRALNMAALSFGSAVDDEKEGDLRLQAVQESTKSVTDQQKFSVSEISRSMLVIHS